MRLTPDASTAAHGNHIAIRVWLYALCGLIFLMVLIGGATRLTDSGLSITEWKPIMGAIPPLGEADWREAFEKYKQIPEYKLVNKGMSLDEFKTIFWWEWSHRFLGRFIGFAFLLPYLFFLFTRRIPQGLNGRLLLMFALGGLQGFVGWYMVKSGLVDRVDVSQYRLALHLGLAILVLGFIFWTALHLGGRNRHPADSRSWRLSWWLAGLVFVQILLGALVAGLNAGLAYNDWPWMNGELIPDGLFVMQPWYLNWFENALTVQFDHRLLAYLIVLLALYHAWRLLRDGRAGALKSAVPLAILIGAQVLLGIATLMAQVPLTLALAHQGVAVLCFLAALWHVSRIEPAARNN